MSLGRWSWRYLRSKLKKIKTPYQNKKFERRFLNNHLPKFDKNIFIWILLIYRIQIKNFLLSLVRWLWRNLRSKLEKIKIPIKIYAHFFKKKLSEDISTTTWPNSIKVFLFEFYESIEFKYKISLNLVRWLRRYLH